MKVCNWRLMASLGMFWLAGAVVAQESRNVKGDAAIDRVEALTNALGVKGVGAKLQTDKFIHSFPELKTKEIEDLIIEVRRKSQGSGEIPSDDLAFKDAKGQVQVFGKIKYAASSYVAQQVLFQDLAMNSLPVSLLVQIYAIDVDGPGELCVVGRVFNKSRQVFEVDHRRIYFIRGNAVIALRSVGDSREVKGVALVVDQVIKDNLK